MPDNPPILDYGQPAPSRWLLRTLAVILIIAAGTVVGGAIGAWIEPDRYIFNGSLMLASSDAGPKQAHIAAIRANIPVATAILNGKGLPITAQEFGDRLTLRDVPQTQLISIRCTSRSPDGPLAMVNALIVPYASNVPGMKPMPGTLDHSITYMLAGCMLGAAATGLMIRICKRR